MPLHNQTYQNYYLLVPPPFISSHSLFSPLPLGSASTTPLKLLLLRRLRTIHDIKRNGQPSVSSYSITLKIFSLSFASVTQPLSGFLLYLWVLSFLLGFTFLYFVKKLGLRPSSLLILYCFPSNIIYMPIMAKLLNPILNSVLCSSPA